MSVRTSLITSICILLITSVAYFFSRLRIARNRIEEYRRRGLPVAPNHNFLFGHLLYIQSIIGGLPKSAHYQYAFAEIAREHFVKEGVFYLDLWPVSGVILVVISPNTATQATQTNVNLSMERPVFLRRFFKPIAGGPNLFDLPEREWKPWRAVFNKGFSADYSVSLVPGMVEETEWYKERLRMLAKEGRIFSLDDVTLRYAMDLIGRTIWNTHLGAQTGYNVLADCMLSQIRWHQPADGINPLENFNLARWYMEWSNGRKMDRYVGDELDKRFEDFTRPELDSNRGKSVIDLVFQAYSPANESPKSDSKLDPELRAFTIRQVRLFMFGGHDSTSSTVCYCLHLLSTHPKTLDLLREEHDRIIGPDISLTASILSSQPSITNSLPYTTAVIKEALRLFAPASTSRRGKANESVTDDEGNVCPTEDTMVHISHIVMHRFPKYWVRPDEFLPERWLVEPGHELYPVKGAWRPFEIGPRNCIAQGLAMTTMKVILASIVREFDFKPAYDEWDALHPRKGAMKYRGERVYQMESAAAHPVERYPCRVSIRTT